MFDVREIDGKMCAVLRCDVCGKAIRSASEGMAVFHDEWGVRFVHNLPPGANYIPDRRKVFDLDIYFFFLCAALGVDMEQAKEKARELKMI